MQHRRSWHISMLLLAFCVAFWGVVSKVSAQSKDLEEAERLNAQVVQLLDSGPYDKAIPLAERALAIREKALGVNHPDVAQSLNHLALLYQAKGEYERAEPMFKRALAINEKALGAQHLDVTWPLNSLASLYHLKGNYVRAQSLHERALAIREKVLGADHFIVAQSLINLAYVHLSRGEYGRAESMFQRALAIYEKAMGVEHPYIAATLIYLADLYVIKSDYGRAEPMYQRALAIYEKALGIEHLYVGTSLNHLAMLYQARGDYGRAESLHRRALTIYEKALGTEHPETAAPLNSLASLYYFKGDYGRAEPIYQRALAIREKAFGGEHYNVAMSLNNLALLYQNKGDYGRAEQMLQRALAIYEKALGKEHPEVGTLLNNLASLYYFKGDYARAEPMFQRALNVMEKAFGPEHPHISASLNNLADLYRSKDDYRRAEPLYQRALVIREKAFGSEHPDVGTSLNNLAELSAFKGDYAHAESLHRRALAIYEKALGGEHPHVATSVSNLSLLYAIKGDYERAITELSRSAEIAEHNIALILSTGSEKQKQLYLDTLYGDTDSIVSLNVKDAPKNNAAARLALTTILRRKGRALDAMTDQIAALRRRAAPEDQKLLDQLSVARSQLANVHLGGVSGNLPLAARQSQFTLLMEEIERLEAAISRRSADFRANAQPVTLSNVQAALPADAALIELFSYEPFDLKAQLREKRFGSARYVAYVIKREGDPQFVDLGEASVIEVNVEKFRAALRDYKRAALGDVTTVNEAARVVDEQVMRPVRALLGETKRLFLSPDGALHLIPFAALVDERGRYLLEDYTLTYLTSGRDLLRLQVTGENKQISLVVANPLYDAESNNRADTFGGIARLDVDFNDIDFSKLYYPALPGTADEAKDLSALLPGARVLTATEATESALKQAHSPRILHVATHGFFLTNQPRQAAVGRGISLGAGAPSSKILTLTAVAPRGENPLLRSGLILAGVNQRRSGGNDDGVLTAAEAAGLDLWGTKLVVLSACETGLGDVKNGDGVYGLRRALVLAGSESQVMSLWRVDDAATRVLMKAYYTRLQEGEGRTAALRQVQLEMLNKLLGVQVIVQSGLSSALGIKPRAGNYSHPYYWAGFIQSGAWFGIENKRQMQ